MLLSNISVRVMVELCSDLEWRTFSSQLAIQWILMSHHVYIMSLLRAYFPEQYYLNDYGLIPVLNTAAVGDL